MTRIFIVEDEMIHAEALKIAIEEAGYQLAGECNNADLAFDEIKKQMPDIALLDISLPGINNGITLASKISNELKIPHIFITSFTHEDVINEAVKTNPGGYLHKPVDATNLKAAIQIALNKQGVPVSRAETDHPVKDVFFTKIGDKLVRINLNEVLIVKADGENCISLVTSSKEIICRNTLKEISIHLPSNFIQVHRAFFINLDHLDSFNEREQVVFLKGKTAPVARTFRKDFLNSLKKF